VAFRPTARTLNEIKAVRRSGDPPSHPCRRERCGFVWGQQGSDIGPDHPRITAAQISPAWHCSRLSDASSAQFGAAVPLPTPSKRCGTERSPRGSCSDCLGGLSVPGRTVVLQAFPTREAHPFRFDRSAERFLERSTLCRSRRKCALATVFPGPLDRDLGRRTSGFGGGLAGVGEGPSATLLGDQLFADQPLHGPIDLALVRVALWR